MKNTVFKFTSYRFDPAENKIFFNYQTELSKNEVVSFTETIVLPKAPDFTKISQELFEKILKDAHLALGISYYKLHCAKKISTNHSLSKEETDFWNAFYKKGLGEFLYRNKLDPGIVAEFPYRENKKPVSFRIERSGGFLVGVGGGKDSIVSVELLKKYNANFSVLFIETQKESEIINNLIREMGVSSMKIKRFLDEKLFDSNEQYFKGHIPISGIYAFLGTLAAAIYGYSYFVVSNEFSSNFGNTKYKGKIINHQWSKSSEFENLFQNYLKKSISPDLFYFSLLRPFYEIRIAELFANYKNYFSLFSSCNNNFKITSANPENKLWCGKCPKCIFTFLILSPFLTKEELIKIFGENYFLNVSALINLRDILGFGKLKPFDCVGTFDEAKTALYMARDKFREDLAGEIFLPEIDPEDKRRFFFNKKVTLEIYFKGKKKPLELMDKVFRTQQSSVPDYLKFLGMKNALILGHGKEGKVTEEYLKRKFPGLEIKISDIIDSPDYLSKQQGCDIAVRTPGIPKECLKIPYTTATNIFFSYVSMLADVKIIGVTGSKGKSTTASLICHMLKKAGKKAVFLGNIGDPMLSALLDEKIEKNTIFVLELSSYQLDDIKFSPNVAVITSLFPEHMDYHHNIKDYFSAKKNIIKYQNKEDVFIFNPKNKKMSSWAKTANSKIVPFAKEIPLADSEIKLPGQHNKDNIKAAIAAVMQFGVSQDVIKDSIKTFKGLPHRLELVGEFEGIKFYDDAISTTPESTILAISALPKIGTIFLGGQDRGYVFTKLEKLIKKRGIKNIVLFPVSGERIFKKGRKGLNILETSSMEDAVKFAYENTKSGEVCLLSCASPSYSLWKNFEEKGDLFQKFVKDFGKK